MLIFTQQSTRPWLAVVLGACLHRRYDDTFALAGDIYEAETSCNKYHNMGQVASSGCNNLAYYSRENPPDTPLQQNPDRPVVAQYNNSKTYVALVVGDGDNINFMKGSRRGWMQDRVTRATGCGIGSAYRHNRTRCFPLLWSISPQLLHLAPAMLRSARAKLFYKLLWHLGLSAPNRSLTFTTFGSAPNMKL